MGERYLDRSDAGMVLAEHLKRYNNRQDVLVLGLPRGGVPVAYEVAKALQAPLDVFLVRKLGVPGHEELAMGAIAMGGVRVLNEHIIQALNISSHTIEAVTLREMRELERRELLYRNHKPLPRICDRIIILVDDGLATGASMRAAASALQHMRLARLIIAVPVAAPSTRDEMCANADEVVCPLAPEMFYGVGWWYDDFAQVADQDVRDMLAMAVREKTAIKQSGPRF